MISKIDVTAATRLADVLAAYPWLPDALIAMDPGFKKLKSPVVRALIKRSTVADAARYAGVGAPELIERLNALVAARPE